MTTSSLFSGAPSSVGGGLLGTASQYSYPLTSGLLNSLYSNPGQYNGPNYSQIALQMAGNPHAGPYAGVPIPKGPGPLTPGGGTTTTSGGSSTGSQILGGLLGVVAKNPSLIQSLGSYLGLGSGLGESSAAIGDALAPAVDTGTASIGGGTAAINENAAGLLSDPSTWSAVGTEPTAAAAGTDAAGTAAGAGAADAAGTAAAGNAIADPEIAAFSADSAAPAAASGSSAAAGAGSLAGGIGVGAAALLPAVLSAFGVLPTVQLTGTYYNNLNNGFNNLVKAGTSDPNFAINAAKLMGSGELSPGQQAQIQQMYQSVYGAQNARIAALANQLGTGNTTGGGSGYANSSRA